MTPSRCVLLVVVLTVLTVARDAPALDRCAQSKLKKIGKKESSLLRCQSRVAQTNDASGLGACEAAAMAKFASVSPGGCVGDLMTCESGADACEAAVAGAMTDTLPSRCEALKRQAAGRLAKSELYCYAGAGAGGVDPNCIAKARARFSGALTRTGTCPDGGSPQTLVEDNCVTAVVSTNSGGVVNALCSTCDVFVLTWGSRGEGDRGFGQPFGVAVDGSGNVYVSDVGNLQVHKFTGDGSFLTAWGGQGSDDGQFGFYGFDSGPGGIAADGSGNVYVSDGTNRIQKFTSDGTFLTKWGSSGAANGQFNDPLGVAVDGAGNVYVADLFNYRIQKFTGDGTFVTTWGSGDANRMYPTGVTVDGSGNVYVVDFGQGGRVQKFTSDGTFLTMWSTPTSAYPGIAVDGSGNVYVSATDGIRKFTSDGTLITAWGFHGHQAGQFDLSVGVAVDGDGNVFVADVYNVRIQKFAGCL